MIKEEYNPKHSPLIEIEKENELYKITVEVGKETKHPNEPTHSIRWIDIYFQPEGKEPIQLARIEFNAHGEENIYTEPKAVIYAKIPEKGKIITIAYCNLHGLWKMEKEI